MSSRRLGGIAGLGFISAVVPANIILGSTGLPLAGASKSEVLAYFADHSTAIGVATSLAALAWLALPLFAAGIVAATWNHERASGDSWSFVALAGAVMQSAIFASVVAIMSALGLAAVSDDVAWGLWQVHNVLFTLNGASLALILVAGSVAGGRAGLLRTWQRNIGLTSAALLATSAVLTPVTLDGHVVGLVGLAGFLLWLTWIASVSVSLLSGSDRQVGGARTPVSATS